MPSRQSTASLQLELPLLDTEERGEPSPTGMPREIESALPRGFQWLPGNALVPGQPFVLWAAPRKPYDFDESRESMERVFEAYRNVVKLWPWCSPVYRFDPNTGTSAIIGIPFRSPKEMVAATVTPMLTDAINRLASAAMKP